MTTSESKGRFFLQNESIRIDSHNQSNRIDSNRELECSRPNQKLVGGKPHGECHHSHRTPARLVPAA